VALFSWTKGNPMKTVAATNPGLRDHRTSRLEKLGVAKPLNSFIASV